VSSTVTTVFEGCLARRATSEGYAILDQCGFFDLPFHNRRPVERTPAVERDRFLGSSLERQKECAHDVAFGPAPLGERLSG
jgi:hypothetical protein